MSDDATPSTAPAAAWEQHLDSLLREIDALATSLDGQAPALLLLLRRVEELHRSIQDGPFRASLPEDRGQLFSLLQAMERSGGWPYIPRLQLRTFMDLMQLDAEAPGGGTRDQPASPANFSGDAGDPPVAA